MKNEFRRLKVDSNSKSFGFKRPLTGRIEDLPKLGKDMAAAIKFMTQVLKETRDVAEKQPLPQLRPSLLRAH